MLNNLKTLLIILSLLYGSQAIGQSNYREILQAKLDSIVKPHEVNTGADFGPDLSFSFKEPFKGVMRSKGSLYSGQLNTINYDAGDSVSLIRVGILGSTFTYGKLDSYKELAILGGKKINNLVELQDSIGFWNQFEKIKKVKVKDFAQYWLLLNCEDENDSVDKRNERAFINFGRNTLGLRLQRIKDIVTLEFDFSISYGNDLRGFMCADSEDAFVEFRFRDGTSIIKHNIDLANCKLFKIEISGDLAQFEKPITEIKFSISKKAKPLNFDHELSQNHINLKIDCLLN